jgi:hypothetical protein
MTSALIGWQPEVAKTSAAMAPTYLRHVCGFGIEQLKLNPSLDSQRPGS